MCDFVPTKTMARSRAERLAKRKDLEILYVGAAYTYIDHRGRMYKVRNSGRALAAE